MPQDIQQVKNKLDNLKKKFRLEKAKQNSIGESVHTWEFYDPMYDLFGSFGKFIGIPNASDNGQRSMQNQSGLTTPTTSSRNYDLNRTPPQSVPSQDIGEQSDEVRINSPNVGSPTYEISSPQSRPRVVIGQAVRTRKTLHSKSLRKIAKAMKGFMEAYRETNSFLLPIFSLQFLKRVFRSFLPA
ncbi:hypothetical protein R1flu_022328 [Riccia fluitans]|uniref:Uncharacterized protein n=1 Tax=Riccia fluitans TaxID=41844 RepID=A0ABD1ZSU1_9MARC